MDVEDKELERLMRKRMLQLQKRLEERKRREAEAQEKEKEEMDPRSVLNKIFYGRAWEIMETARIQYPGIAEAVQKVLIRMARDGRIGKVSGEELYTLFLRLGYKVKLKTHIHIHEHGEIKTLEEKLREGLKES